MDALRRFTSTLVALPVDDVDTDQIVPARFLKVTDREGLAGALFADWRNDEFGHPRPDFPLNRMAARRGAILVVGRNFGCGSSREHAAWALLANGFRVVIATAFADIFRGNAIGNGLLPVVVAPVMHAELLRLAREEPHAEIVVDVENHLITLPHGMTATFPLDRFDSECLLRGVDRLGFLLEADDDIARFEASYAPGPNTVAGPR